MWGPWGLGAAFPGNPGWGQTQGGNWELLWAHDSGSGGGRLSGFPWLPGEEEGKLGDRLWGTRPVSGGPHHSFFPQSSRSVRGSCRNYTDSSRAWSPCTASPRPL